MAARNERFDKIWFPSIKKPGEEDRRRVWPILKVSKSIVGKGGEVNVHKTKLDYENKKGLEGLVFKSFHDDKKLWRTQRGEREYRLDKVLEQWDVIKRIRSELRKQGKDGFNMPGTVRGVKSDGQTGILMTDLSEGGKKDVIDLKRLVLPQEAQKVPRKEWDKLRENVLRDVTIGLEHNISLIREQDESEEEPKDILDPWTVVVDKESGTCKLVITDIGQYSGSPVDKITQKDLEKLNKHLNRIEHRIVSEHWDWDEYERRNRTKPEDRE